MKNILIVLLVPALLVGYFIGANYFLSDFETKGQFGDMFGAVNALFSGLAFLGIIYTIRLQSKELGYQREELKLTRDELRRSADAQQKSEESLTKQAESLKVTAKLNGLSSLLQYELAKTDKDNTVGDDPYGGVARAGQWRSPDEMKKIKEIVSNIENIVQGE